MREAKTVTVAQPSQEVLHAEHNLWRDENAMWRDDVSEWRKQLEQSIADLQAVEATLRRHGDVLKSHESAVAVANQESDEHERVLAEFARGGPGQRLLQLLDAHRKTAIRHAQQRDAHERLKKQHHMLIAQCHLLLKSLTDFV
ncbi:MAG: hypothetical protein HYS13_15735 [Planctomycetia bacterium]|nr:hypothetical protein [Planctomycetia bacterium]